MYKSNNMSDHNITRDQIEDLLKVDFNGPIRSYKSYKIEGMTEIVQDQVIINQIKIILNAANNDNNLDVNKTNFFSFGIALKNNGFTLCLGSDQAVDIFKVYEDEFNLLIDKVADIFQRIHREVKKASLN